MDTVREGTVNSGMCTAFLGVVQIDGHDTPLLCKISIVQSEEMSLVLQETHTVSTFTSQYCIMIDPTT